MTTRSLLARLLAGLALSALPALALAEGEVTFGTQWWDQDHPEAKYNEFREIPNGGLLESYLLQETWGRNGLTLLGAHALRNDQASALTWTNGARWRLDLGYQRIPHTFSLIGRTPYAQSDRGVFTLADAIQQRNQTTPGSAYVGTMTDVLANAQHTPLGFRTDITDGRLRSRPVRGLQIEIRGSERRRTGNKPYGASFGFSSAVELIEPIDQRTLDGEVRLDYQRDRVSVQATGGVSVFENEIPSLIWDNPKRLTDTTYAGAYSTGDGPARGRTDLYPTNRALRGSVALGLQLPQRTALTATVGLGRHKQNDAWLPFTTNTAIPQAATTPLPGTSTDAEARTLSQDYRLVSRALSKVTGTLRFSQFKLDNKTEEHTFLGYSRLDATWVADTVTAHPFSNEQMTFGADLDATPVSRVTIGGTFERRRREHTLREVEKDDENVFGVRLNVRPSDVVTLQGRYQHGKRELDAFHLDDYRQDGDPNRPLIEQPGLRRYDVADRKRDEAGGGLSWMVGERLELAATYGFVRNDYDQSLLGLQEEKQHSFVAEATVHASERVDLSGGYGFGKLQVSQRSSESGATLSTADSTRWTADVDDRNVYVFATADWEVGPKISLRAGYEFSRDRAKYDLANDPSKVVQLAQDLPETFYRRHDAALELRYQLAGGLDLAGRYAFERFEVDDFASQSFDFVTQGTGNPEFPAVSTTAIYLGDAIQDYDAHRVALLLRKKF